MKLLAILLLSSISCFALNAKMINSGASVGYRIDTISTQKAPKSPVRSKEGSEFWGKIIFSGNTDSEPSFSFSNLVYNRVYEIFFATENGTGKIIGKISKIILKLNINQNRLKKS